MIDLFLQYLVFILEILFTMSVFLFMGLAIYFMDKFSHEEKKK